MAEISQPQGANKPARIRCKKFSTRIDMTPMVDLAFLLLTFFILTTTLNKLNVMEIAVPEQPNGRPQPPIPASRVLTFILDEGDKIYWRKGLSDPLEFVSSSHEQLSKLLTNKNAEIDRMLVLIKATDKSRYQNLVDIIDEIMNTKIERYCIVDIEPKDEALLSHVKKISAPIARTGK
ncbi:MAG: biopolymer transporter ExbD [Bacteroidetes bacterium]|nr:biopolymer transporter ExbD [Bacteroidota bacterium]